MEFSRQNVRIKTQRKRHEAYLMFFTDDDDMCYCHDVRGLFEGIGMECNGDDWRPFIVSIVLKNRVFETAWKKTKRAVFFRKNRHFWKSWKNSSRMAHNVQLLQNLCVVLRLDSSLFSF